MTRRTMRALVTAAAAALSVARAAPAEAASALVTIAPEIAGALGAAPASAEAKNAPALLARAPVVVASPLASDVPAPRGDELAVRVAQVIAGKLGGAARAHGKPESLAAARAVAGKAGALVYVQLEIARGELRATADLYPARANAWDRIRVPAPPALAHAFAHAPIDAEVRAFLAPVLLERAALHKARHEEAEVLAAACGDLDGDGGADLALVTRARVAVGHVRGGKFEVSAAAPWAKLAPLAPVPLREPLAGAVMRTGELVVGTTDRAAVRLDASLAARGPAGGIPVPFAGRAGCAQPSAELGAFEGGILACGEPSTAPLLTPSLPRYDAFAHADITQPDGSARAAWAERGPGGKLVLHVGDRAVTVEGAGAQIAVGDLDLDGAPELASSADAGDDAVSVSTWTGAGLRPRAKLAAPAGVRALAVCPPEAGGAPALVAVVGQEVWIWR